MDSIFKRLEKLEGAEDAQFESGIEYIKVQWFNYEFRIQPHIGVGYKTGMLVYVSTTVEEQCAYPYIEGDRRITAFMRYLGISKEKQDEMFVEFVGDEGADGLPEATRGFTHLIPYEGYH